MQRRIEHASGRVAVVMATRDRRDSALQSLRHLTALPDRPRIVVVDNGSSDGTAAAVRTEHPSVRVVELGVNLGAAARTVGVARVAEPHVAFADDDSWWTAGALARAAELFDVSPRLALIAGRVLVGPESRLDPVCAEMARSPLPRDAAVPFPSVLGFIACGAIVRRAPFLACGGFHPRFGVGGEEELLALDLRAGGWELAYVDDVVAHHHPSPARNPTRRRQVQTRNDLWTAWLRRAGTTAARRTLRAASAAFRDRSARRGLTDALRGVRWVARERRAVPAEVEHLARSLSR